MELDLLLDWIVLCYSMVSWGVSFTCLLRKISR